MVLSLSFFLIHCQVMTMDGIKRGLAISVGIFVAAGSAAAGWFGADFSAEIYEVSPQGQIVQGWMFVGQGKVRTEMTVHGNTRIEIIDPEKGLAWLLEPSTNSYRERLVQKRAATEADDNPCTGLVSASCDYLGEEMLNDRASRKWRIGINGRQQIQWRDSEHRFPVKIVANGRSLMEMQFLGPDTIASRKVESWLAIQYTTQGTLKAKLWYDPQLNIAIRQQMPNGVMRELRNIRLQTQQQSLFVVPGKFRLSDAN